MAEPTKASTRSVDGRMLSLAEGSGPALAGLVAIGLATTATYVGQGLLVAHVIAGIFDGQTVGSLAPLLIGAVALQFVRAFLLWVREARAMAVAGRVKRTIRRRLYAKLLALGPGYVIRHRSGDLTTTFVDGVEALERYVALFVPQIYISIIGAAAIAGFIFLLSPVVGAVVLGCAILVPIAPFVATRYYRSRGGEWWKVYRRIYSENLDAIQGMSTLKAFDASVRRGQDLHDESKSFADASIRLTFTSSLFNGIVGFSESAGTALSVGIGALLLAKGELSVTSLLVILLLARECFRPLHDLQEAYHSGYVAMSTAAGIRALLDTEPEAPEPSDPRAAPDTHRARGLAVSFREVTFAYRAGGRRALDGLSLDVHAGETVALVGRSGAGKTTVVSLLLRFFETQEGRILVGGHDIRSMGAADLRRLIAVVSQDTYLFHATVRQNLVLGKPHATDEEVESAARAAEAHGFISQLPQGYDTVVGERGMKLSGGERQRIAIARAILKDAPILVLDEATSSVDAANEASIQQALVRVSRDRTTLVIAHRLSTVRDADRIVVLDAGRAVEAGDHEALIGDGGAYARLVAAQGGVA